RRRTPGLSRCHGSSPSLCRLPAHPAAHPGQSRAATRGRICSGGGGIGYARNRGRPRPAPGWPPAMTRPLAIDLFCGLGGWTEGLLAEGYDVVGFDIERHEYGDHRYPAQLVIQDVLTLHG